MTEFTRHYEALVHAECYKRIAKLKSQLAETQTALHASASLNADLDKQLVEAREDTARMDWRETQNKNASLQLYLGGPWRYFSQDNPAQGYWKFEDRPDLGKHETLREAIDAARKEPK